MGPHYPLKWVMSSCLYTNYFTQTAGYYCISKLLHDLDAHKGLRLVRVADSQVLAETISYSTD